LPILILTLLQFWYIILFRIQSRSIKMAVESQSQAPLRYMAVPEKIELGGGGGARDPPGGEGRYRPMKVLEATTRGYNNIS
jgi:hypothetical protein